jgi:hypothetical protein
MDDKLGMYSRNQEVVLVLGPYLSPVSDAEEVELVVRWTYYGCCF